MMKFAASVSLAALALAGCATTPPAQMAADCADRGTRRRAGGRRRLSADPRRRPRLRRGGRKGSVRPQRHRRPRRSGSTPPTSTTIPTRWPPISARSAPKRASNMPPRRPNMRGSRASTSTPRASSTSCAARWSWRRRHAGRGGRAQHHRDPAAVDLRQGPRAPQGQGNHRRRRRRADGDAAQPRRARRNLAELARECRPADAQRLYPPGRDRQRRRQGARLCRHRRHVAVATMT